MTFMTKESFEAIKQLNTCKACKRMVWNCNCKKEDTQSKQKENK